MPKQSKYMSLIEAKSNAVIGLIVSWLFTYHALPLFGLTPDRTEALAITGCYFILSFARSYVIRRAFVWWGERKR